MEDNNKLLFEEETYKIIGACMKVHRSLGTGFLESVYQESVERELSKQAVEFDRQVRLQLTYDGQPLKKYFIADFVCFQEIIIELKAVSFIHKAMEAQVINYLKATDKKVGILVNFGEQSLTWKRFINTKSV